MKCNCYVSQLSDRERFVIRWGAHDPECPVFSPSLDPVDAVDDAETRLHYILVAFENR
jgi:hypothetical protein